MSGGVDSSVTAALLKEQGHEVIGMTMQIWDSSPFTVRNGETFGTCCSLDDVYDARRVAEGLGIPFYVVNFEKDFQRQVIDRFCDDYFAGRTPNPCVLCNQILKFELLLRRAREVEADLLATGHYGRIAPGPDGAPALWRAVDDDKDQSYFLFSMPAAALARGVFPLGGMAKPAGRGLGRGFLQHRRRVGRDGGFFQAQDTRKKQWHRRVGRAVAAYGNANCIERAVIQQRDAGVNRRGIIPADLDIFRRNLNRRVVEIVADVGPGGLPSLV